MVEFPDINPAIAELWLALAAMALLLVGVLRGDSATRSVLWLGVLTLAVAAWLVWSNTDVSAVTSRGCTLPTTSAHSPRS